MPWSRLITFSAVEFPASAQHSSAITKLLTPMAMQARRPPRVSGTAARTTPMAMDTAPSA